VHASSNNIHKTVRSMLGQPGWLGLFGRHSRFRTVLFFTYFELKKLSAGTGLGLLWTIFDPFARILIYIFVFTIVLKVRLPGPNSGAFSYSIYIMLGLIPWTFVSACLNEGAGMVHTYAGFIRQPNFPYRILPNVVLLTNLPAHLIGMAFVIVMMAVSGDLGHIDLPLVALAYALLFVTVRGAASILGALAAVVPDVRRFLSIVLTAVVYVAPILYLPEQLGRWKLVGILDPFSYLLTTLKYAMTGDRRYLLISPAGDFFVLFCLAAVAVVLQNRILRRVRQTGIDYVA
jgi:ABC-type polysaccharide/polyol phosphate export permease